MHNDRRLDFVAIVITADDDDAKGQTVDKADKFYRILREQLCRMLCGHPGDDLPQVIPTPADARYAHALIAQSNTSQ